MKNDSKLAAWLQLFRAPNLLTVPGDPIAGYLLATRGYPAFSSWALSAVLSSVCFYCAGLLLNDLADIKRDRMERPDRPLPSGRVSFLSALLLCVAFFVAALALSFSAGPCAFRIGLLLLAAILGYNLLLKKIPWLGPLNMGACRGLSLLLGATAGPFCYVIHAPVIFATVFLALYITSATQIARDETQPQRIGWRERSLPVGILACGYLLLSRAISFFSLENWLGFSVPYLIALVSSAFAAVHIFAATRRAEQSVAAGYIKELTEAEGLSVPRAVGALIGNVLLLQAALVLGVANGRNVWIGLVLLAFWPLTRVLSRRVNMS